MQIPVIQAYGHPSMTRLEDIDGYLANVKISRPSLRLRIAVFTADTITLSSMNDLTMSTKSVGIGVAVNVANVSSAVLVKNSDFRSTKNIEMTAKSVIKSDVNADAKSRKYCSWRFCHRRNY